jgi:hypothetical protein
MILMGCWKYFSIVHDDARIKKYMPNPTPGQIKELVGLKYTWNGVRVSTSF